MIDNAFNPKWTIGKSWRVEYEQELPAVESRVFASPRVVREIIRYKVIEKRETEHEKVFIVKVWQEDANEHYIMTFRQEDYTLIDVTEFITDWEGETKKRQFCRNPYDHDSYSRSDVGVDTFLVIMDFPKLPYMVQDGLSLAVGDSWHIEVELDSEAKDEQSLLPPQPFLRSSLDHGLTFRNYEIIGEKEDQVGPILQIKCCEEGIDAEDRHERIDIRKIDHDIISVTQMEGGTRTELDNSQSDSRIEIPRAIETRMVENRTEERIPGAAFSHKSIYFDDGRLMIELYREHNEPLRGRNSTFFLWHPGQPWWSEAKCLTFSTCGGITLYKKGRLIEE